MRIGHSVGVILPQGVWSRSKLANADTMFVTDAANGVVATTRGPEFDTPLAAARAVMNIRATCCASWPSDLCGLAGRRGPAARALRGTLIASRRTKGGPRAELSA
jgi:hypothetical protein